MGRSVKELRQSLAPITGVSLSSDKALIGRAVPAEQPTPLAEKVKEVAQDLRQGYPKRTL